MREAFSLAAVLRKWRCRLIGHREDGNSPPTSRMFMCRRCLRGVPR